MKKLAHPFGAWLAALILLAGLAFIPQACTHSPRATKTTGEAKGRIGVYDSRAVCIAYAGSEMFDKKMKALLAEGKAAKAAGEEQKAAEIENQAKGQQHKFHLQGFSTAPVDDILAEIQDMLPAIREQAGVAEIVSKWDQGALAARKSAEQVDVTMMLVDAFNPKAISRKWAEEIQAKEPMPLEKAEEFFKKNPGI